MQKVQRSHTKEVITILFLEHFENEPFAFSDVLSIVYLLFFESFIMNNKNNILFFRNRISVRCQKANVHQKLLTVR